MEFLLFVAIAFMLSVFGYLAGAVSGYFAGKSEILGSLKMPDYIDEDLNDSR